MGLWVSHPEPIEITKMESSMREQTGLGYNARALQSSRQYAEASTIHSDDQPSPLANTPDIWEPPRMPTSTRRYQGSGNQGNIIQVTHHPKQPIQRASRTRQTQDPLTPVPQLPRKAQSKQKQRNWLLGKHPLFYIGGFVVIAMLGWFLISALVNWVHMSLDNLHYGRPRTSQTDLDVGHGGVSHFTTENLQGHVIVTELPNNDPSKAKIYAGPTLVGGDPWLIPVTLSFKDVNGDGQLDMLFVVDGHEYATFLNGKDGMFHPPSGN
jgi:hypothetical protein